MLTHAPETTGNDLFDVEDARTTNANVQSRERSPGKQRAELSTTDVDGSVTISNTARHSGGRAALNSATTNTIVVSSGTIVADLLDEPDGGWISQKDMMQSVVVPYSETLASTTSNTVAGTSNLNLTDRLRLDLTVARTVIGSGRGPDSGIPKDEQERRSGQPAYVAHITPAEAIRERSE
jgi:hypothetical protein